MFSDLTSALFSFVLFFVAFLPLEHLFAARPQKFFRQEYFTDFLFYLGQAILWTAPVVFCLAALSRWVDLLPLGDFRALVRAQPYWLQFLEAIALCDFCIYWGHRLQHRYPFLWRFHKVHHTAEHLDWLAAYREHPLDNLYTRTIENLPIILLGFPLETIAGYVVFRGMWGLFIHSNVTLSVGPLKYLLGSPRIHHWHHEKFVGGRYNYANLMPLMDKLFGTFYEPKEEPSAYGISDLAAHSYPAQLLEPLLPKAWQRATLEWWKSS